MGIAVQECLYIEELYISVVYVDRKKGRYFFIVSHVKFDIENKKERTKTTLFCCLPFRTETKQKFKQ